MLVVWFGPMASSFYDYIVRLVGNISYNIDMSKNIFTKYNLAGTTKTDNIRPPSPTPFSHPQHSVENY